MMDSRPRTRIQSFRPSFSARKAVLKALAHNKRNCPERLKGAPALPKNRKTAATSTLTPTLPLSVDQLAAIASSVELSMHQQKSSMHVMS
ncbi:hypothetical protein PsorP6_003279 [Peronosclerospora sorghi]|uniref:Uncharacterized protein n=1 Tax=Peronosclerospora sorghi TaxID=230839 RepID=A0ACC0VIP0_9STRA|nr:hypothetical protein PsorP6_003279 [Peronosclerospora sorghi]